MLGLENLEPEEQAQGDPGIDFRAVWQLTSMSLGVGLFAIPYCFGALGVLQGGILVVVLGFLANTAIERLLDCAELRNLSKYEEIANFAFGRAGQVAMACVIAVTTWIASLSYLAAALELLVCVALAFLAGVDIDEIGGSAAVLSRGKRSLLLLALIAVPTPKLLRRSMGDNAFVSTAGVCAMCAAAVVFIGSCVLTLSGCQQEPCSHPPALIKGNVQEVLENMATLAFSFSMVFAVFPLVGDRAAASGSVAVAVRSMRAVVRTSITFSVCIYLLVGLTGAFAFSSQIRKLALQNLPLQNVLPQLTFTVVGVCSLLLVAIVAFPCIESLALCHHLAWPASRRDARAAIVACVAIMSVLTDAFIDTKIAFALTGALGLSLAAYVMPALLYLRLRGSSGGRWRSFSAYILLLFGGMVLLGGTPATVVAAMQKPGSSPGTLSDLVCPQAFKL